MDVDEFKEIFAEEAITHLSAFERGILALEKNSADTEAINDIFRAVHTMKGAAGMVGLVATSRFSHAAESYLDEVRNGSETLNKEKVSLLLSVHDVLKMVIEKEISGNVGAVLESEVARLVGILRGQVGQAATSQPQAVSAAPAPPRSLKKKFIQLRCKAAMAQNGFDPLAFIRYLKNAGEILNCRVLHSFPEEASAFDPELLYLNFEVVLETEKNEEEIRDIFSLAGDLVTLTIGADQRSEERSTAPARAVVTAEVTADAERQKKNYLRIESGRLDSLIDSIGELVMTGAALKSLQPSGADERYTDQMALLERQVETMRDSAMSLRIFSLSEVFRRFERVVRDISSEAGKEVELEISGGETEIDKNLMDGVYDPLVHIIRNSVDHGIEPAEVRRQKGKSPVGKIVVRAERMAGMIYISVEDDGSGPNLAKIEQRARERGLLKEGQPTEKELIEMVFQPGFSTAEKVTSLSGRGVGMDVVRQNVTRLNGSVTMTRSPAGGTVVSIRLPLTLAIIDGLLIQSGRNKYIIPLAQVIECVDYDEFGEGGAVTGIFSLRGEALPIIPLGTVFGEESATPRVVVVVQNADKRRGIFIDKPLGEMQIVVKPIENIPGIPQIFNGATILGDGQVALILDLTNLIEYAREDADVIKKGLKLELGKTA
jgi:two-component system, chemotaxis family, sensor kinase CheA